jgi:ATP-dependent RNA helicase DeaD
MDMTIEKKTNAGEAFAKLGLDRNLVKTLAVLGYEEPTPIQQEAIPPLLEGRDLMGQAATGTGKTAAFALPMLQRLTVHDGTPGQPAALILVPTRELAMQVAEAVHKYGQRLRISVVPIYGGSSFGQQQRMMGRGVDVVVATPGRALDHIRRETLDLSEVAMLVLDEADEMLDMGFAEDLEAILSEIPAERQTVLFSATLPPRINGLAKRHMRDAVRIQIAGEPLAKGSLPRLRQTAYIVPRTQKLGALGRILDLESPDSTLVFCRTRTEVDELVERLSAHGYRAQALHGGMRQDDRTRVIKQLREGAIDLVVATDVAARGLDIEQLSHVVNYDMPPTADAYIHRVGRVGRAGREGVAITLADPRESRLLQQFERKTQRKIQISQVPTTADLRARRLELTRTALQEALAEGGLEHYRTVVEALAQEHDPMSIAMAAVKIAHEATGGERTEPVIEPVAVRPPKDRTPDRKERKDHKEGKERKRESARPAGKDARRTLSEGMIRLYVGTGLSSGITPSDLVGALAGESGISGKSIGAIEILEHSSLVEVQEELADKVIAAMRGRMIKGKTVSVRRFVER